MVLPILTPGVQHVVTINEPNILAMISGFASAGAEKGDEELAAGALPPPDDAVGDGLIAAHRRAVDLVRSAGIAVGWSVAPQHLYADPGAEEVLRAYAYPREIRYLEAADGDDFIGARAYTRTRITATGPAPVPDDVETTLTGWEYYPAPTRRRSG